MHRSGELQHLVGVDVHARGQARARPSPARPLRLRRPPSQRAAGARLGRCRLRAAAAPRTQGQGRPPARRAAGHPARAPARFASELLRSGANLRQIQELLGRKHLDSTQRYTRVTSRNVGRRLRATSKSCAGGSLSGPASRGVCCRAPHRPRPLLATSRRSSTVSPTTPSSVSLSLIVTSGGCAERAEYRRRERRLDLRSGEPFGLQFAAGGVDQCEQHREMPRGRDV